MGWGTLESRDCVVRTTAGESSACNSSRVAKRTLLFILDTVVVVYHVTIVAMDMGC